MKFITDNFGLDNDAAVKLFHEYAKEMPIIDYHCHLSPQEIYEDKMWDNIAQVWLGGDHYKWRVMRTNGVAEKFCTGDAPDREKFQKFAESLPYALRNPMYHWCHLELARYFGIDDVVLSGDTAQDVWDRANAELKNLSARTLMTKSGVKAVCTTDDPIDSLEYHKALAAEGFAVKVLPTWRPDKAMAIDKEFYLDYLKSLSEVSGVEIKDFASLKEAVKVRHQFFHDAGCRLSDHGLDTMYASDYTEEEVAAIFAKALAGTKVTEKEDFKFKTAMMVLFGHLDAEKGWTKQLHIGAIRNNNTRLFKLLGPDTGFDSVDDQNFARPMAKYLDMLDQDDKLPKTIIYNLNPRDNEVIATLIGCFQDGTSAGKIQFGSGWWFLDQLDGMTRQIESLSQLGLLRRFVGMLTDSRSFLSYTRHEYFRRLLCNILGSDMEKGLIPMDFDMVGAMVREISFENARDYFGFDLN
ncbi:MAG: glucuronate isomerase [Spirochaetales bacterium]|nr:glucuronate isomerase [Spirochaetales bacterium]